MTIGEHSDVATGSTIRLRKRKGNKKTDADGSGGAKTKHRTSRVGVEMVMGGQKPYRTIRGKVIDGDAGELAIGVALEQDDK
jgi:hypothetical protein